MSQMASRSLPIHILSKHPSVMERKNGTAPYEEFSRHGFISSSEGPHVSSMSHL